MSAQVTSTAGLQIPDSHHPGHGSAGLPEPSLTASTHPLLPPAASGDRQAAFLCWIPASPVLSAPCCHVTFPKPQGTKGQSTPSSKGAEKTVRKQLSTFALPSPLHEASFHAEVSRDRGREGKTPQNTWKMPPCRPACILLCCGFPFEARAPLEGLSGKAVWSASPAQAEPAGGLITDRERRPGFLDSQ